VPHDIGVGLSATVWMQHSRIAGSPLAWPPRSPDITPLDFFLWGYVKDKVCAAKVTAVEDLKTWIRDVITTINRERHAGSHMGRIGISTGCSLCDTGCPH
jgi:hypothetical protein